MSKGPLAVRWGDRRRRCGARGPCRVELENAGTVAWREGIMLASHWLDNRDNPIVWDGPRNDVPRLAPGEGAAVEARIRVPIPPGRYRLAFDMVAELRAWFSELGSPMLGRRRGRTARRRAERRAARVVEPAADWAERVAPPTPRASGSSPARSTGTAASSAVARARSPYRPGPGRVPGFSSPLLCPSVLPGVELEPLAEIEGLPAFAAPRDEPWVYDGRIVLRRPRRQYGVEDASNVELDRDAVVDPAEDERAEGERDAAATQVDDVGQPRRVADQSASRTA